MVRTSAEAEAVALAQHSNVPGTCQATVRQWFDAPAAGDQDGDGDADAVDGWLSEPLHARHPGDRNPPRGKPLAFGGGSHGFGHRTATVLPHGIQSTDMSANHYKAGVTSTVKAPTVAEAIAIIERSMGVFYLGWSGTIDGQPIPDDEPDAKPKPPTKPAKPTKPPQKPKPLTVMTKARVVHRLARRARKAGHERWAARLDAWSMALMHREQNKAGK